jgi:amidase
MSEQTDLCYLPAVEQARLLDTRQLSAVELLDAHLAQLARVNPVVNAVVTLTDDAARNAARASDERRARGLRASPIDGLTLGVKDLFLTRGVRTTFGSPIYADFVPQTDHLIVEREKAAGAVIVGKTNTPEFGAGAQTFNPVFGITRNPYDPTRTCGGSSGGSAVALACGMLALADGSDFGGSLRAPAAWCNVAGFRPSPGRVPSFPTRQAWSTLSVHGPMARTIADLALFLRAIAGPDPRTPLAIEQPAEIFAAPLARDLRGVRVAWSPDLGHLPVDGEIVQICEAAVAVLSQLGCVVEPAHPDFTGASEIFKTLRAAKFAVDRVDEIDQHRDLVKRTVIDNAETGLRQSGLEVSRAEVRRGELWQRVRAFMNTHEFMVTPVNPVAPFPADQETLTEIGGVRLDTYVDWGALRHVVSLLGLPSVSVPCGFTTDGLPVGLQITGRHHQDLAVLQVAHAYEDATGWWRRRPPLAA